MADLASPRTSPRFQAALLAIGLLILLAAGLLGSGIISSSLEMIAATATRARDQADAAEDVLLSLQKAESGQRGYLLTGRLSDLGPYQDAAANIGHQFARLATLADGTTWLQSDTAELRSLSDQKMAELQRVLGVMDTSGRDAALRLVQTDNGQLEMEAARTVATRIRAHAEAERDAGAAALRARQHAFGMGSTVALIVGVALLAIAGLSLIRNRAALLRARSGERLEAARLQAAIDHVPDGVAVFDGAGRLTLQNTRFARTVGLPSEQVRLGTTLAELATAVTMDPPVLDQPGPGPRPAMTEVRQGGRVLEVWRSRMPDLGQMVAIIDITRRVQAEAIARQAQKMEMIGQMTGGIAHDFNNLLQVISANVELAIERLMLSGAEPDMVERLEAATAGVARGAQLTRHLLAFARRQQLTPEPIEPARLVRSLEDTLRRTLGEAVELTLTLEPGLWAMRADPTQMESALLNLALNARDAMIGENAAATGRVTITVANTTIDAAAAGTHQEVAPGDYVSFAVADTGIGMTEAELGRALEPFYTTKPEGKGTGLGLPMVFGFAKQSGGHFALTSEKGRGTIARLLIPRTTDVIEQPATPAQTRTEAAGELVLLVEDDAAVRRVAAAALRSLGYEVATAGNGDEALAALQAGLRPAVLFCDVVMPGTVGSRELAAAARKAVAGVAVLFTSGYGQGAGVEDGEVGPGNFLLRKPWRTEELRDALRSALAASSKTPVHSGRRVLLVEDEALVRMITADALSDMGFEVITAESGGAALARLDPAPDLMITDLGLPDIDGVTLIAHVRARLPGIPVIVASGRDATQADAIHLSKPYDAAALYRALEAALSVLAD